MDEIESLMTQMGFETLGLGRDMEHLNFFHINWAWFRLVRWFHGDNLELWGYSLEHGRHVASIAIGTLGSMFPTITNGNPLCRDHDILEQWDFTLLHNLQEPLSANFALCPLLTTPAHRYLLHDRSWLVGVWWLFLGTLRGRLIGLILKWL